MTDWQPIETAPKDGTEILTSAFGRITIVYWDNQSFNRKPRPFWNTYLVRGDRNRQPTHWMPLPEPPK